MGFNLLKKLQAINSRRRDIQPQLVIVLFYSLNNLWIFTINIELLHSSGLLVLLWCIQSPYGWWNFVRTSFRSCNNSPSSAALVTEFCANNRGGPSFFLHWILFERLGLHKKNLSYNNIYQLVLTYLDNIGRSPWLWNISCHMPTSTRQHSIDGRYTVYWGLNLQWRVQCRNKTHKKSCAQLEYIIYPRLNALKDVPSLVGRHYYCL